MVTEWKSIKTAPKDGTRIIAYGLAYAELSDDGFRWLIADDAKQPKPMIAIISWLAQWTDKEIDLGNGTFRKEKELTFSYWKPHAHAFNPTHWMALPNPPEEANLDA